MKGIEKNLVFVVDDNPVHSFLTREMLLIKNYAKDVEIFNDGINAFESIKNRIENGLPMPEVIFLDISMPEWDAWDFLEEFNKIEQNNFTTVYLLSSSLFIIDEEKARMYNLQDAYLVKPLTLGQIEILA